MKNKIIAIIFIILIAVLIVILIVNPTVTKHYDKEFQAIEIFPANNEYKENVLIKNVGEYSYSLFAPHSFRGKIIVEGHDVTSKYDVQINDVSSDQGHTLKYEIDGGYYLFGEMWSKNNFSQFFISVYDRNENDVAGWDELNSKYIVSANNREVAIKIIDELNPLYAKYFNNKP